MQHDQLANWFFRAILIPQQIIAELNDESKIMQNTAEPSSAVTYSLHIGQSLPSLMLKMNKYIQRQLCF